MNPRPHRRKRTRSGSGSGMKGYSAGASSGAGLSDVGYARWVTAETKAHGHAVVVNPASYLMGMAKLGTPVGWAGKPGYKGSGLEARVRQEAVRSRGMTGEQTTLHGTRDVGFGRAAMGGMGRGEWERPQIKKEEAKGGAGIGTVVALGGLASIAWLVLR